MLGRDAVSFDVWHMQCLNFRLLLDPEDIGSKFHRKIRKLLPDYTASHPTAAAVFIITQQEDIRLWLS
jgi:hypothetical protein